MVEIGVLGPVAVMRADRSLHVGGFRQRALLVRLLLAKGRSVPAGVLVDDLWDAPSAGDALKTSASRLRHVLGPDVVVHDGSGYALHVADAHVDAHCFEARIADARAYRYDDPERAAARYGRALDLWRGPALGDIAAAEWARPEAARLEELRLVATEERFGTLIAAGGAAELVADLAATAREYPWREQLTAHLMVALYRCGRQRDALEAFGRLSRSLREDLGLEPSPPVRELERAILRQDPDLDPPSRFEGAAAGAKVAATTRFVGRAGELERLEIATNRNPLVSLVGPAGTGKTRLADQLRHRLASRLADGSCFVALGTLRAPGLVATTIATALGLVDSAEAEPLDPAQLLSGYLRDRELLLVLDGCEPALEVVAELVAHLLAECTRLRILTTSREPLGLDEEIVELGPMETPRAGASCDEVTGTDSVRLYLERSGKRDETETADLLAIGELTRLIGGNPLAIELVAGLTGSMPPSTVLARAREMLGTTSRVITTRHATLQTTLALSHERLTDSERILFRRAGVFAAGFGIAALEAVAGGAGLNESEIAAVLGALETSALVYPMGHAPDRRRMLDTVREEALDRLREAGELDVTLARQVAYYVELAERCDRELRGDAQDEARRTLDLELDNLRDLLARLLLARDGETAARLTVALGDYWYLRGHWAESRRWVGHCVAATNGSRSLARAQLLRSDAHQAGFSGLAARIAKLETALTLAREHDAREDEVWILLYMAGAAGSTGDYAEMHRLIADADRLIADLDDPWTRAVRRSYVAATDLTLDPADARAEQLQAHHELLALGDRAWAGRCLWFAGSIARRQNDFATAETELRAAIELCERAGDRAATAHARASLTRAVLARGDQDAQALFERSVEELAAIGDAHCADNLRAAMTAAPQPNRRSRNVTSRNDSTTRASGGNVQ